MTPYAILLPIRANAFGREYRTSDREFRRGVGEPYRVVMLQGDARDAGYALFESEDDAYRHWLREAEIFSDYSDWSAAGKFSGEAYREAGITPPEPMFTSWFSGEVVRLSRESPTIPLESALGRGRTFYQDPQPPVMTYAINLPNAQWVTPKPKQLHDLISRIWEKPAPALQQYEIRCQRCRRRWLLNIPGDFEKPVQERIFLDQTQGIREEECVT